MNPLSRREKEAGFTLVEMMVAMALSLVVMSAATAATVENWRSVDTVSARRADQDSAQAMLQRIASAVRGASAVQVMCLSGSTWGSCSGAPASSSPVPSTEVFVYNALATPACTVWGITSTNRLELAGAAPSTAMTGSIELYGVRTGSSFSYFTSYNGLLDVNLVVQYQSSSSANGSQQASTSVQMELEADDPNLAAAVGTGTSPPSSCQQPTWT